MAKKKKAVKSVKAKISHLRMSAKKLHEELKDLNEKLPHGYTVERRKRK